MWTDKQIKSFKPREARYRVSEKANGRGRGRLVLDVLPSGQKDFYYQYFRDGVRRYVKIGGYKRSARDSGFTLSEARDRAIEFSNILKEGFDVKHFLEERRYREQERIRELEREKRQGTFEQLLDSYLAALKGAGKRSHESVRRSLKRYVRDPFPELLRERANAIEGKHIGLILRRMLDNGITTHTNRVRAYLHAAFQHGLNHDNNPRRYAAEGVMFNLVANPVSAVPRQADYEKAGEHVIPETEIPVIWTELPKETPIAGAAVKLALTTGIRTGELIRLKPENFDFKERLITIPSSVSKNGVEHVVPMNDLAVQVVKDLLKVTGNCDYAFPGLKRRKYFGHIHVTTVGTVIREFCEKREDVTKFTPQHDIRRTVKTLMGKAGISKEVRDRLQNHALQDVSARHYDRYDYLAEKRQAVEVWNGMLARIIQGKSSGVVEQIREAG